ncbi:hypothetical protein HID58_080391 [Brassica napus]|uniref:DUF4283 domain-containing protein n=1 Tax=Brassica napus TaxID=3708 RepID=A0ABQ7Y4R0_BRANA|nr:hypothetical protein HID58_080391 [Brassica napus]
MATAIVSEGDGDGDGSNPNGGDRFYPNGEGSPNQSGEDENPLCNAFVASEADLGKEKATEKLMALITRVPTEGVDETALESGKQTTFEVGETSGGRKAVTAWAKKKSKASETEAAITVVDGVANMDIPEEIFDEAELLWKSFVVGHFIGDAPHIGSIHATVNRIWSSSKAGSKIDVQFIEKNTVLFRIEDNQMRARVLQRKHWNITDIPLVVNVWSPESAMNPPDLSAMPLWVDLKGVPNNLYSHKGLRCLSKAVGKFVRLHPSTEKCVRLDVARVHVEVDLQQPMVERIAFSDSKGEKREVEVNFPWVPPRCSICCRWGHKGKDCTSKEVIIMKKQSEVKDADVYANAPEPRSSRAIGHEIEDLILDLEALKPGSVVGKPLCVIEPTTEALRSVEAGKWETNHGKKHGAGANGAQNTKSGGIEEDCKDGEDFQVSGKEMEEGEIYESMNDGKKGQRASASNSGKRVATASFSRQVMGKSVRAKDLMLAGKQGDQSQTVSSSALFRFQALGSSSYARLSMHSTQQQREFSYGRI